MYVINHLIGWDIKFLVGTTPPRVLLRDFLYKYFYELGWALASSCAVLEHVCIPTKLLVPQILGPGILTNKQKIN
jgi:hypothetical protein